MLHRCWPCVSGVVVAWLLLGPRVAAQTLFEDGTFAVDDSDMLVDWSDHGPFILPASAGPGRMQSSQLVEDEDPYLSFEVEGEAVALGESSEAWAILINDTAEFDPAGPGPIRSITLDFIGRRPPGGVGNRAVTFALEQRGYRWAAIAERVFVGDDLWMPMQIAGLEESDFTFHTWGQDGQPETPDFSDAGPPITLGIATGTSCPTTSDCSVTVVAEVHIDDWTVNVFTDDDPIPDAGIPDGGGGGTGGIDDPNDYVDDPGCQCRVPTGDGGGGGLTLVTMVAFVGICLARMRRRRRRASKKA